MIISVNDTNDNGPVFSQSSYIGKVLENSLIGTKVIHVQANDADYVSFLNLLKFSFGVDVL